MHWFYGAGLAYAQPWGFMFAFSVEYVVDCIIWKYLLHLPQNGKKILPHSVMLNLVNGMWEVTVLLSKEDLKSDLIPLVLPFRPEDVYVTVAHNAPSSAGVPEGEERWRHVTQSPGIHGHMALAKDVAWAKNGFVALSYWSFRAVFGATSGLI